VPFFAGKKKKKKKDQGKKNQSPWVTGRKRRKRPTPLYFGEPVQPFAFFQKRRKENRERG